MSRYIVSLFIVAMIGIVPFGLAQKTGAGQYSAMQEEIVRLINEYRATKQLQPLAHNAVIAEAAGRHSRDMASKKVPFGHAGVEQRVAGITKKLKTVYGWAENVAAGPTSAKEVVDAWLNSKVHRENIEGDYNLIGIGIAKGSDGMLYYTAIFINKS